MDIRFVEDCIMYRISKRFEDKDMILKNHISYCDERDVLVNQCDYKNTSFFV